MARVVSPSADDVEGRPGADCVEELVDDLLRLPRAALRPLLRRVRAVPDAVVLALALRGHLKSAPSTHLSPRVRTIVLTQPGTSRKALTLQPALERRRGLCRGSCATGRGAHTGRSGCWYGPRRCSSAGAPCRMPCTHSACAARTCSSRVQSQGWTRAVSGGAPAAMHSSPTAVASATSMSRRHAEHPVGIMLSIPSFYAQHPDAASRHPAVEVAALVGRQLRAEDAPW